MSDDLDTFEWYRSTQANHRLLCADEERALLRRRKDPAALAELVACNQRLVLNVAHRFARSPLAGTRDETRLDVMDLVQAGNLGLLTAIRKFDLSTPYRFSTYALPWVQAYIRRYCLRQGETLNLSTRDATRYHRTRRAYDHLAQRQHAEPSAVQVAGEVGLSVRDVDFYNLSRRHFSLDDKSLYVDDSREATTPDPSSLVWQAASDAAVDVHALLARLDDPRHRQALALRFGLGGGPPLPYHKIGAALGYSRTAAQTFVTDGLQELRRLAATIPAPAPYMG